MVYADANILVRYIINDEADMAAKEKTTLTIQIAFQRAYSVCDDEKILSFDKKLNNFILRKKL